MIGQASRNPWIRLRYPHVYQHPIARSLSIDVTEGHHNTLSETHRPSCEKQSLLPSNTSILQVIKEITLADWGSRQGNQSH